MIPPDARRLASARPELLAHLRDAHRGLEPEARRLGDRERLRTLAERSVGREDPAAGDLVFAREDDLVDGGDAVECLELSDGEGADVVELPARGEVEDGGPFVWGARFPGAEVPGSPIPQDHASLVGAVEEDALKNIRWIEHPEQSLEFDRRGT